MLREMKDALWLRIFFSSFFFVLLESLFKSDCIFGRLRCSHLELSCGEFSQAKSLTLICTMVRSQVHFQASFFLSDVGARTLILTTREPMSHEGNYPSKNVTFENKKKLEGVWLVALTKDIFEFVLFQKYSTKSS